MKKCIFILLFSIVLSGCNSFQNIKGELDMCSLRLEEVLDELIFNDIEYVPTYEDANSDDIGEKIGEVKSSMSDHNCEEYEMKNGDSIWLPAGTEIFQHKGYQSSFRIIADNRIYQVVKNDQAKVIADLYDIEEKVTKITSNSVQDGAPLLDFTPEEMKKFMDIYLTLEYVGFEENREAVNFGNSFFIEMHLQDASSLTITYYDEGNAFSPGVFGTEEMELLMDTIMTKTNEIQKNNK